MTATRRQEKGIQQRVTDARRARPAIAIGWAFAAGPVVALLLKLPWAAWCALFGYHAGCWMANRAARAAPEARHPPGPAARTLGLHGALLAGLATFTVVVASAAAAAALVPSILSAPRPVWNRIGLAPPFDVAWFAYYMLVNPWIEERFWRGTLLDAGVRERLGRRAAPAVATLLFGGHHLAALVASWGWGLGPVLLVPVLVVSGLWTESRRRTGGIALATASHYGADLGLAVAYLLWLRS